MQAGIALSHEQRRDPDAMYNRVSKDDLQSLLTSIEWDEYFTALGAPSSVYKRLVVTSKKYLQDLDGVIKGMSAMEFDHYLQWRAYISLGTTLGSDHLELYLNYIRAIYGIDRPVTAHP